HVAVARVVEGGIQTAVGVEGLRDEVLDSGRVADVGGHGERATACGTDVLGDRRQGVLIARGEHDGGADRGKGAGGGGANAAARAGNDGHLAGEVRGDGDGCGHGSSSFVGRGSAPDAPCLRASYYPVCCATGSGTMKTAQTSARSDTQSCRLC